ncbi:hypothetical protein FKW77_003277 [Venturia effusa]|uniref:F-box domain-containing protein n=1 Tax=Venturia effusa TaxID=50376 RepID=A0A517LC42_9PEZI|nr:hypothetical protein FKW77_003277 [Venturia effusa]
MPLPQLHELPAFSKVMAIPELEESVLFQLPMSEILRVQTVSRHWQDVITKSPSIQKKLFLQPDQDASGDPQLNSLLRELFPSLFRTQCAAGRGFQCPDEKEMVSIKQLMKEPFFLNPEKRARVLQEDASWRKMFPVQPPARIGRMVEGNGCEFFESAIFGSLSPSFSHMNDPGVRMGFVYDYFIQLLANFHQIKGRLLSRLPEISAFSSKLEQTHLCPAPKNEIDLYFFIICECMCPGQDSSYYNGWEELVVQKQEENAMHYDIDADGYSKRTYGVAAPGQADDEY